MPSRPSLFHGETEAKFPAGPVVSRVDTRRNLWSLECNIFTRAPRTPRGSGSSRRRPLPARSTSFHRCLTSRPVALTSTPSNGLEPDTQPVWRQTAHIQRLSPDDDTLTQKTRLPFALFLLMALSLFSGTGHRTLIWGVGVPLLL